MTELLALEQVARALRDLEEVKCDESESLRALRGICKLVEVRNK